MWESHLNAWQRCKTVEVALIIRKPLCTPGFPWTFQWWRQWHLIIINYVDGADITQLNWHQLGKSQWRFWATTRPLPSLSHLEMMQVMQFWSLSCPDTKAWKLFAELQTGLFVLSPRQGVNTGGQMQITVWSLCVSVASAQQPLLGRQKNSRDFGFQFSVKFRIWNELKYGSFPVYSVSKSTLICLSAS